MSHAERVAFLNQLLVAISKDPVKLLPTELLIIVLSYLPILDVWRLRIVCRSWHDTLSLPPVVTAATLRYDTHHPSDSARPYIGYGTPERRANSFRNALLGKASAYLKLVDRSAIPILDEGTPFPARSFDLKGGILAYFRHGLTLTNACVVRDLVNGTSTTLQGEARESLSLLTLSESLVAFINYHGILYTALLDSLHNSRRSTRIPSSSILAISGNGQCIALLMAPQTEGFGHTICVYDRQCDMLRSFGLKEGLCPRPGKHGHFDPQTLLVHSSPTRYVDVFGVVKPMFPHGFRYGDIRPPAILRHLRFTHDGKKVCETSVDVVHPDPTGNWASSELHLRDVRPAGGLHQYQIHVKKSLRTDTHYILFHFDSSHTPKLRLGPTTKLRPLMWKDTLYLVNDVCFTRTTNTGLLPWRPESRLAPDVRSDVDPLYKEPPTIVNDTFLVVFDRRELAFHVFCFDETIQCHGSQAVPALDAISDT